MGQCDVPACVFIHFLKSVSADEKRFGSSTWVGCRRLIGKTTRVLAAAIPTLPPPSSDVAGVGGDAKNHQAFEYFPIGPAVSVEESAT